MKQLMLESLKARFQAYNDIAQSIDDETLGKKIEVPKHKSLLEHVWCIIGARESYALAIEEGKWSGFSCSMSKYDVTEVVEKLETSAQSVLVAVDGVDNWTSGREALLLKLSEHEVMHEGAIIRHMYACELDIPSSVQWA